MLMPKVLPAKSDKPGMYLNQSGILICSLFNPRITQLRPSIMRLSGNFTIPHSESNTPLNICLTPSQARSQSPVNTPVIKSIRPMKMFLSPPMISPTDLNILSNTATNTLLTNSAKGLNTFFHRNSNTLISASIIGLKTLAKKLANGTKM